jgi:glycosyltransferase involved in cell wall biosynthesis
MKIILVHVGGVHKYPPALSVLYILKDLGYEVVLCTTDVTTSTKKLCKENDIKLYNIDVDYYKSVSLITKFLRLFKIKKFIWKSVKKEKCDNMVLWISSTETMKHLGNEIYKYKYILHFYELVEDILYTYKLPFLKINANKLCNNSERVIEAEYNRAYITMVNWELDRVPAVLPNKPYYVSEMEKEMNITSNDEVENLIEKLEDKKIILYQGKVSPERPLIEYIKAIKKLGDEYALVIMSGDENIYKDFESDNFYFVPYITPPKHLEVTSHAFIGILTYVPEFRYKGASLNTVYCAPNKLYEYSMFGIPMIGNDIPGLATPFEKFNAGVCISDIKEENIYNALLEIEKKYNEYSIGSKRLYNNTDLKSSIKNIIENIE